MTFKQFLFVALIFFTTAGWANAADGVNEGDPKNKNLFIVKTEKKFAGAKVEVLTADGDLITAQNVQNRKVIIDFGSVKLGTYIIRVSKDNEKREFQYEKK